MTVEEQVRAALSSMASTTEVSPDGWEQIEAGVERRRRRRCGTWAIGGPAVALAGVALLVALLPSADKGPSVTAGPAPAAPVARYAPLGLLKEGYSLQSASAGGSEAPATSGRIRVYGQRAADGLGLDQLAMVITAGSPEDAARLRSLRPGSITEADCGGRSCIGYPSKEATLKGRPMVVKDAFGQGSTVVWDDPEGPTIGVVQRGMSEDDYYALVDQVKLSGGYAFPLTLPAGFAEVHDGVWPAEPGLLSPNVVIQRWAKEPPGAGEVTLEVHQGPGVSLDTRAWLLAPGGTRVSVGRQPGLHQPGQWTLVWSTQPGVVLAVVAPYQQRDQLLAIAESVQPISEKDWSTLYNGLAVASPPIARVQPSADAGTAIATGETDGERWTISWRGPSAGASGCLELQLPSSASGLCQVELAGESKVAGISYLGEGPTFVVATVGKGVESVRVEWSGGRPSGTRADVVGQSLGLPANFVVVPVPPGSVRPVALVGLAADGGELDRQTVPDLPVTPSTLAPVPPTAAGR